MRHFLLKPVNPPSNLKGIHSPALDLFANSVTTGVVSCNTISAPIVTDLSSRLERVEIEIQILHKTIQSLMTCIQNVNFVGAPSSGGRTPQCASPRCITPNNSDDDLDPLPPRSGAQGNGNSRLL